ncbi:MAG: hypothetical protein WCJ95_20480, partial [Mariniphaga sp.]
MNKLIMFCGGLVLVFLISCTNVREEQVVSLDTGWKFKTGDDIARATVACDDSKWDTLDPKTPWEGQGYKGYDGFAWYRLHIVIPSSLKENAFIKDSLKVLLGKIDDCDQVFLNGELIGENGRTIYAKTEPAAGFIKVQGKWNVDRRYVLAVNDPRIHWGRDNVIAVRCFDQDGAGGVFGKPFEISMTGLKDQLKFDFSSSAFIFSGDSMVIKKITILNLSGTEEFKGKLLVDAVIIDNGINISSESTGIDITP